MAEGAASRRGAAAPRERPGRERELLRAARARGPLAMLGAFVRLAGPGWLQSAITLGGGSLAGSLYLGVLCGFELLWVQPLAMAAGVVMLSAIAWVTLSTGERPFQLINRRIDPVLGWSWAIATLLANVVWSLPQFSLGTAAVQQNLLPALAGTGGKVIVSVVLLGAAVTVIWIYDRGGRGVRAFEAVLKVMVGLIVASFFGVVALLSVRGALDWSAVLAGFVPDLSLLTEPATKLAARLAELPAASRAFWEARIVADQRDVIVTAAATAVGINMTFLLPYSMRARGWDREFRGLALFDLGTGLLVPFVLATGCVVIAAGARLHARPDPELLGGADAPPALRAGFERLLDARLHAEVGPRFETLPAAERAARRAQLPEEERRLASMLVRRDAFQLARALEPLTGKAVAQYVFGIGVLGMALSTILVLMLISGFVVCEMLGLEPRGAPRRWGSLLAGLGVLGPFVWSEARFWLAVPTSVFGMMLLPIAYLAFFALMNHRGVLGEDLPRGVRRLVVNLVLGLALALALFGAGWSIQSKAGVAGVGVAAALLAGIGVSQAVRRFRSRP